MPIRSGASIRPPCQPTPRHAIPAVFSPSFAYVSLGPPGVSNRTPPSNVVRHSLTSSSVLPLRRWTPIATPANRSAQLYLFIFAENTGPLLSIYAAVSPFAYAALRRPLHPPSIHPLRSPYGECLDQPRSNSAACFFAHLIITSVARAPLFKISNSCIPLIYISPGPLFRPPISASTTCLGHTTSSPPSLPSTYYAPSVGLRPSDFNPQRAGLPAYFLVPSTSNQPMSCGITPIIICPRVHLPSRAIFLRVCVLASLPITLRLRPPRAAPFSFLSMVISLLAGWWRNTRLSK